MCCTYYTSIITSFSVLKNRVSQAINIRQSFLPAFYIVNLTDSVVNGGMRPSPLAAIPIRPSSSIFVPGSVVVAGRGREQLGEGGVVMLV